MVGDEAGGVEFGPLEPGVGCEVGGEVREDGGGDLGGGGDGGDDEADVEDVEGVGVIGRRGVEDVLRREGEVGIRGEGGLWWEHDGGEVDSD